MVSEDDPSFNETHPIFFLSSQGAMYFGYAELLLIKLSNVGCRDSITAVCTLLNVLCLLVCVSSVVITY